MRTYYVLLSFGIFLCIYGLILMATPFRSSYVRESAQKGVPIVETRDFWIYPGNILGSYSGIFGFILLLCGILICIVSGILIERKKKKA